MISFLGEFEATVDAKGRFLLPGGVKKQFPEGDNRFVISRGFEKCLRLYPMASWEPVMKQIMELNDFDPKAREFKRKFLGGATQVELDTAGRMLMPASLKEYAGLGKDIILVAQGDKFEIWDSGKYKQIFEGFSDEEFSNLANEVMGNKGGGNGIGN